MAKSNGQQTTVDPQANEWISKAMEDGVKPEQALAFMGLGLMQRLNGEDNSFTTIWQESQEGQADLFGVAILRHCEIRQFYQELFLGHPVAYIAVMEINW